MSAEPSTAKPRIASLDQFRGYTVVGMLFVNFLGNLDALPAIFKHHNSYCSYADTIMPQFFFAVGFAYRLTFLRRRQTLGTAKASAVGQPRAARVAATSSLPSAWEIACRSGLRVEPVSATRTNWDASRIEPG